VFTVGDRAANQMPGAIKGEDETELTAELPVGPFRQT
jgi:hypothetical protein